MSQDSRINYLEADTQTREKLDALLEGIDLCPDSFEAVIGFGASQLSRMNAVMDNLKEFIAAGPGVDGREREAKFLRAAHAAAVEDMRMLLGAGREGLRRYAEEYIPQAAMDFNRSRDPEDQLMLNEVTRRKDELISRLETFSAPRLPRSFSLALAAAEHFQQHLQAGLPLEQSVTVRPPLKITVPQR